MAMRKPKKNVGRGRPVRRKAHSSRAENMGAAEMMIPTLEARVYSRAVFSRIKVEGETSNASTDEG